MVVAAQITHNVPHKIAKMGNVNHFAQLVDVIVILIVSAFLINVNKISLAQVVLIMVANALWIHIVILMFV
jgi:hypothetical protein